MFMEILDLRRETPSFNAGEKTLSLPWVPRKDKIPKKGEIIVLYAVRKADVIKKKKKSTETGVQLLACKDRHRGETRHKLDGGEKHIKDFREKPRKENKVR